MLLDPAAGSQCNNVLQAPLVLNHSFFNAVIDTGSTFSLMQQKVWQRLKRKDELLTKAIRHSCLLMARVKKLKVKYSGNVRCMDQNTRSHSM